MLFYLLFFTLIISFAFVIYFIRKFYNDKKYNNDNTNIQLIPDTWTDENKLFFKQFITENEPNKNIVDCIFNKIISLYTYTQFDNFYKEISKYKENPDPSISLSNDTQLFMSNLIDIEYNCGK
jgi:hypothetical protein